MRDRMNRRSIAGKRNRLVLVLGTVAVAVLAYSWGRMDPLPRAAAVEPENQPKAEAPLPTAPEPSVGYANRVVAYIHGSIPITREELGEYLIVRQGADKLELLVNKRIIEHACRERGIEVTAAEVEAALEEDSKGFGIDRKGFVEKVLRQYHKTEYEWKEDVIKSRLLLTKLCRNQVQVTDEDIRQAFESHYGEKVECRVILIPKGDSDRVPTQVWEQARKSEEEFNRLAKQQVNPALASTGGAVKPISRHAGAPDIEKEAFSLEPGEVSRLIGTPEGAVILRCVRRIPAETGKELEKERPALEKEVLEKKIQREIPEVFKKLRAEAQPKVFLQNYTHIEDVKRDSAQELDPQSKKAATPPQAN